MHFDIVAGDFICLPLDAHPCNIFHLIEPDFAETTADVPLHDGPRKA